MSSVSALQLSCNLRIHIFAGTHAPRENHSIVCASPTALLSHALLLYLPHSQVWDLSSRKVIRFYEGHGGGVNTVLFHPDGTCIASGSTDGSLKVSMVLDVDAGCVVLLG